jgi:glucokinase
MKFLIGEAMARASWTIGVDLGGTKLDIGIVDMSGNVIDRMLIKTKAQEGAKAIIQDIITAIQELCAKNTQGNIVSIGVGVAGQIDSETGSVHFAPNLNWHDIPLQQELRDILGLPVYVINDVRAATWGEWLHGAGKGEDDLLCLFIGTGIGGGIVSGGQMLTGCSNSAGEVGHMTIDVNGPKCTCGNYGCFEALAGGWAIARRAREAVIHDPQAGKAFLSLVDGKAEDLSAKHVFQLFRSGDPLARLIVNEVSNYLVAGVAGLVNVFNPRRIIIGGGIINGHPEFINEIRAGVSKRALHVAVEHLQVVEAALHVDAGMIGAAAFARNAHK